MKKKYQLQIFHSKMTIRELIKERQAEVGKSDLQPPRAAEILNELASLIGNCNDEIRIRDVEYNQILLRFLASEEKANWAKIKAETSAEYLAKREARDTKEVVIEMIRSLKFFLKAKEEEYRLSKNM